MAASHVNENALFPRKHTKITIKYEKAHLVCLFVFSWLLRTQRFYLSTAGQRTALYFVNDKVGKLEVLFDPSFEESTSKTSLKFTWNSSTWLPASPCAKKDDVRSFLSNSLSEVY